MKNTENIIQKFRQKFKHSQFVNYSAIESWLEEQIPLIQDKAVRETAKDIREQVYHCLYDGQWIEKAPYEHFEASKINLTFFQRVIFEKYLQPKTQDSEAGDGYCMFHSFMGKRVEIKNCADCNINKIQESEAGGEER